MSASNPSITASAIITDVESRLGSPNISASDYYPWISYAYQKTYAALANAGQGVKEALFGNYTTIPLVSGTTEYSLSSNIPRFASMIKLEVLYGASGDLRNTAGKVKSIAQIPDMSHISTTYYSKTSPYYYIIEDTIGIIPTPDGGTAYVWYIRRPYQITDGADIIDIDYRFIYPIVNYVQAKALEKENEDYQAAALIENKFERELEQIAITASGEYNEEDGDSVEDSSSALNDNPFHY
jgi:hypothetical protein